MSLRLRADGCNDLPSMENWLNAGADWTEHHGIEVTPTASAELFYERTTQTASTTGDTTASLFETLPKEQPPQQQQALTTHPFLKLDTLELCKEDPVDTLRELCKEDPEALLLRTGSSSMMDSSSNEVDEVSDHVANSTLPESTTGISLDRTPLYADETNLYLEADSPRGPLSPAALQLGKSPRTTCTTTTTTTNNNNNKRPFDDLQAATPTAYAPFVAMANSTTPATTTTFLPATPAASSGILFPTPLTLPTVPSMEEIAQSRPKRRNVKISTDPQSVAARHRRERISDRVRVLQHFVPGGTKMDTASMLDEAIHYVKFLQQQLQTLERLGNSYDARFMTGPGGPVMMPQVGNNNNNNNNSGSSMRSFDLNCAVYQSLPCTSMMMQSASPQPQNVTAWPTTSSFCSQGFPDSAQEQFCH